MSIGLLMSCSRIENSSAATKTINSEGFPITRKPIALTMWGLQSGRIPDMESNIAFQYMKELTNIELNYHIESSLNGPEKLAKVLYSDNLPDVLYCSGLTYLDEIKYGGEGIIIPLNDLIEEYGTNIKRVFEMDPIYKKSITSPDGNIYALPSIKDSYTSHFVMNKTWLNKLGLEIPHDLDSFYMMLKAFKHGNPNGNDKNDVIPLSGKGLSLFNDFLSNWGVLYGENGMYVYPGESIVKYANIQPETKDALFYFRKLHSEGLLDPEVFVQDDALLNDKGTSGRLGVFQSNGAFTVVGYDLHFDYDSFEPFVDPYGNKLVNNSIPVISGRFAITSKCKYPEAMIRWADYLFSLDGSVLKWMGVENKTYRWITPDTWDWILPEGASVSDFRRDNTFYYLSPGTNIDSLGSTLWRQQSDDIETSIRTMRDCAGKYGVYPFPKAYFSNEDFNKIKVSMTAIEGYVNQSLVDFITGETDIEENWDVYVSTVKSMGIQNIIDIYQRYFNEWIS